MASELTIRPAQQEDFDAILALARSVATEADAYAWESPGDEELSNFWLPSPDDGFDTFVCIDGAGLVGVYVLNPSAGGRGAHIAHGSYMVQATSRGRGVGKLLCAHSIAEAKLKGYIGMRINMVVSSNFAALRVCCALGFKVICTLPKAFRHPLRGLLDTHMMFLDLTEAVESDLVVSRPLLSYPAAAGCAVFNVGDLVRLEPKFGGNGLGATDFTSEPPLPPGLTIDPSSGKISGTPLDLQEQSRYVISARITTELTLGVNEAPSCSSEASVTINEDFATMVENVTNVADLIPEPSKVRAFGDWMIWMVHRAYLNDPSLVDFDFTNAHMPAGHVEPRIAPKLMKAMSTNSYIEVLALSNANVQKLEAVELASSLRENAVLKTLNLDGNCLDSASIREIALAIKDNSELPLQHLRVAHQKQMGQFFGRPTEEAIGQMMEKNTRIVKLGFECDDAHWRNLIDRALLRNNDAWRRAQAPVSPEDLPPAEERSLGQIMLQRPPATNVPWCDSCESYRTYVVATGRLPTTVQLQNCAKNSGKTLPYTVAAPLVRECRAWLLQQAVGKQVLVVDSFGTDTPGVLSSWSDVNEHYSLELLGQGEDEGRRFLFKSLKEPSVTVSDSWVQWLRGYGTYGGA